MSLRIALTGTVPPDGRAGFRARLVRLGATYVADLDETVDLLVVGEGALPARIADARRRGIEICPLVALDDRLADTAPAPVAGPRGGTSAPVVPVDAAAVSLEPGHVRVLDIIAPRVDRSHPLTPSLGAFPGWTFDADTVRVLRGVLRAAVLGHPALLEGPTASTKTSAVLWCAAALGQPVARINLNGQTDASELIGRYAPDDDGGWTFVEGLVPRALREGWWLLLDEANLAEPSVLERLNPVLERSPTLVLTEGEGARFGPGGIGVHPGFRVFATQNPSTYQGRLVLSPAWRDRFSVTLQVAPPTEEALRAMLVRAVHGRQPDVVQAGLRWRGAMDGPPTHEALAVLPEALWGALAALHAGLGHMATASGVDDASLGARRRDPPVFSRRGLLALLDALGRLERFDPVEGRTIGLLDDPAGGLRDALRAGYLDRLDDPEDRRRVRDLIEACGLDPAGSGTLLEGSA